MLLKKAGSTAKILAGSRKRFKYIKLTANKKALKYTEFNLLLYKPYLFYKIFLSFFSSFLSFFF
jgi:hypothetical protein